MPSSPATRSPVQRTFSLDLDVETRLYVHACTWQSPRLCCSLIAVRSDRSRYCITRRRLLRACVSTFVSRHSSVSIDDVRQAFTRIFPSASPHVEKTVSTQKQALKRRRRSTLDTPLMLPNVGVRENHDEATLQKMVWRCKQCSLINSAQRNMNQCAGCHSPRTSEKLRSVEMDKWYCESCSTLNLLQHIRCQQCDARRKSYRISFESSSKSRRSSFVDDGRESDDIMAAICETTETYRPTQRTFSKLPHHVLILHTNILTRYHSYRLTTTLATPRALKQIFGYSWSILIPPALFHRGLVVHSAVANVERTCAVSCRTDLLVTMSCLCCSENDDEWRGECVLSSCVWHGWRVSERSAWRTRGRRHDAKFQVVKRRPKDHL